MDLFSKRFFFFYLLMTFRTKNIHIRYNERVNYIESLHPSVQRNISS